MSNDKKQPNETVSRRDLLAAGGGVAARVATGAANSGAHKTAIETGPFRVTPPRGLSITQDR
ncbi:MAG: hypothetical protein ACN4GT_06710, partial [Gammaproteobacteria bacterium]